MAKVGRAIPAIEIGGIRRSGWDNGEKKRKVPLFPEIQDSVNEREVIATLGRAKAADDIRDKGWVRVLRIE